jgi:hypothetical protein
VYDRAVVLYARGLLRRLHWSGRAIAGAIVVGSITGPDPPKVRADALLVEDPRPLVELEDHGFSFSDVVGWERAAQIQRVVEQDIAELKRGQTESSPRRLFKPEWLKRGSFELIGVVNRLDRRRFDPTGCGEVRLVYRLALRNRRRPVTRLPMTINVRIPRPKPAGETDCRGVAKRWLAREDLVTLLHELPEPAEIEINYQSVHVPASQKDMDDSAEYVLRAFEVHGRAVRIEGLFNTPRSDLPTSELVAWVAQHLREIDDGSAVLPKPWLAERVVSISPRGLLHAANRPFSSRLDAAAFAALPLSSLAIARTPDLLLRRLDESTCAGCHQTHGVAGFHLLGSERTRAAFNALAVGHSPHLGADLVWRASDLASAARGELGAPRPFSGYPTGEASSDCGLVPGLAAWSCRDGLACRDIHHGDVGVCARPAGNEPGDPCEDVSITPSARPEGPIVAALPPDRTCPAPVETQREGRFCAPNWLGFTGGLCSERCSSVGERDGVGVCVQVPSAGYEGDCFLSDEPIESCLERHFVTVRVASCDAEHPCRDGYGCAKVPSAKEGTGACVPPYFIFQARVDGPRLDR